MASDNNSGLYLIVGGLLVAAIVFGYVVWGPPGGNLGNIQPAAGLPSYTSSTTKETVTEQDTNVLGETEKETTTRTKTESTTP